jgi:hypothetical protein
MTSFDSGGADDNIVRDLYLFFRLVCQRCSAEWERRVNLNEQFNSKGEAWAEAFASHFGPVAQAEGWGSVDGNVMCPSCMDLMKIRKQVYELTQGDLVQVPIWEFALDEEGQQGQDEATVRPWKKTGFLDPTQGTFIVRAAFRLADGTRYVGYLTLRADRDVSIPAVQPVIVTESGQVMFWYGVLTPDAESLRNAYRSLGGTQVFPIRYESDARLFRGQISGTLTGFLRYRSYADQTVITIK